VVLESLTSYLDALRWTTWTTSVTRTEFARAAALRAVPAGKRTTTNPHGRRVGLVLPFFPVARRGAAPLTTEVNECDVSPDGLRR